MPEQTYTVVLDRFEDEQAVLLCEDDGEVVEELVVPKWFLPPDGRHQDAIFTLRTGEVDQTVLAYQPAETEKRQKEAQSRFDRLSQSLSDQEPHDES
ncbi:DUF3006 domain-containing protein [Haloarchaeobius amylolyticus]|uniref:DUF3006 domain-containing protein n=1 Tax=Haloarchaeobius amylolyticus TaxID=1198296 RepID=UPI002270D05D|nr:DUF3006 domain-containing protein [Haloarchaeobius amylolyticus]